MAWTQADANLALEETRRAVAAMEQVAPSPPAQGNEWFCNACAFRTHVTPEAEEHALANHHPFQHILYERNGPDGKRVRRIHGEDGKVVRLMQPKRGRRG